MSETPKPGQELADPSMAAEIAEIERSLPGGDMIPIDDEFQPEIIVGDLMRMARNVEAHSEKDITAAIERTENLLEKLQVMANIQSPVALPKIVWVLSIFIPELRKQVAVYYKRKIDAADTRARHAKIAEVVNPLIAELRIIIEQKNPKNERERRLEKARLEELVKSLEDHEVKLQKYLRDRLFKMPRLVTSEIRINPWNTKTWDTDAMDTDTDGVLYLPTYDKTNKVPHSKLVTNLKQFIFAIKESLQVAGISIDTSKFEDILDPTNTDNVKAEYGDRRTGVPLYWYKDLTPLTTEIKVAIEDFERFLKKKREELESYPSE